MEWNFSKQREYIYHHIQHTFRITQGVPKRSDHLNNLTGHFQKKCFRQKMYGFKGGIR